MASSDVLSIGELARRTGLSVSAIRYYETRGFLSASRGAGNQRRFTRADIRRLSFVLIAQQLGLSLTEIEAELSKLPHDKAPTRKDWRAIGAAIRVTLDAKIEVLRLTSLLLDSCIGCGCLSLKECTLYNPRDRAARVGPGPRFLLGDRPSDFANE